MIDDRARGGEAITKVPRDESTSVGGREEEIVENVFNDDFLVVVALVNFNQNEDVRSNRVVDSGRKGRFFRRKEAEIIARNEGADGHTNNEHTENDGGDYPW